MIANVGLLNPQSYDPSNKVDAYRLGFAAWAKSKGVTLQGQPALARLGNILIGFVEHFLAKELPQNGLLANIPIKSVAVWDTVGSMGIPVYANDRRNDLFRFVDTKLSERIANGFHARAIDEMRTDFPVTRWDARSDVTQVWFVGAHADVGGGYPPMESRLSDAPLSWMMKKLCDVGVSFVAPPVYIPEPTSAGPAIHEPWAKPPFDHLAQAPRQVLPEDTLHQSVVQRWTKDASYRPMAMAAFGNRDSAAFNVDTAIYARSVARRAIGLDRRLVPSGFVHQPWGKLSHGCEPCSVSTVHVAHRSYPASQDHEADRRPITQLGHRIRGGSGPR